MSVPYAFTVLIATCLAIVYCQETLDVLQPIVKISPARAANQSTDDRFGFAVTAHRLEDVAEADSFQDALAKTVVIVGAPLGLFPGGISGLEYGEFACSSNDTVPENLTATTQEVRAECFEDAFNSTGLVYRCGLDTADCGPLLGSGDPLTPDGYLFERSGNDPDIKTTTVNAEDGDEVKDDQQMGFRLVSDDGFFVACAPMWKHVGTNGGPQPRGRCVYSDRSLSNFTILLPCISGNRLNQNMGGFCAVGMGLAIKAQSDAVQIALGTPGRYFSRGGVAYYANASNIDVVSGYGQPDVPPSIGETDIVGRKDFKNTPSPSGTVGYYGFSISSGRILTDSGPTQFLVGAPHLDKLTLLGKVFVLPDVSSFNSSGYRNISENFIQGEQFSELFGYSVLAIDLNSDGYDDAVVGAPLYYEREQPEKGRIFVFENDQNGGFRNASKIVGQKMGSRFGISLTSLGDLNNDGFLDFAVGAPFEDSGVVYIYYGQARDSNGRIVNPQYAQRIDGGSFVNRVSNLTEVSRFGFSISGNVDVDNNQYNDLVVGAYNSQSVFVLRSRPYARVNSTVSSVKEVKLNSFGCELGGLYYSCFNVQICASFSGRGVADYFNTTVIVEEVSRPRRLQFTTDTTRSSVTKPIMFQGADQQECVNVTAYIFNTSTSLEEFQLSARVQNIDRPDVVVDTTTAPIDLSVLPYIESQSLDLSVGVFAECGPDDFCNSDLLIQLKNISYFTQSGELSADQDRLVVEDVQRIDLVATFSNAAEDAFNSFVTFSVPRQFFTFETASVNQVRTRCIELESNATHDNRKCNVITPLSTSSGEVELAMQLTVLDSIMGNEGAATIPISIFVGVNSSRNAEEDGLLSNNTVPVVIPIGARSVFTVSTAFNPNAEIYQGNHTPVVDGIASNLGQLITLTTTFRNGGPSTVLNGRVTVYVPTRSDLTGDYYFYYPVSVSTAGNGIECAASEGINPEGYRMSSNSNTRRRRSVRRKNKHGLLRTLRQAMIEYNVDCERTPENCVKIMCNITNLGRSGVDVVVSGYLDERFYNGKSIPYYLLASANGSVLEDFYDTDGSRNADNSTLSLSSESRSSGSGGVPWYVIAAPIAAAVIFFILLVIALYYFGFLRRKTKTEQTTGEDEFDQFDSNPFGKGAGPPPAASAPPGIGTPLGDPELTRYDEKKEKF